MDQSSSNRERPIRLFPRREVLRDGAIVAGALVTGSMLTMRGVGASQATPSATPIDPATYAPAALTTAELDTLKAASDRLIPSDELGPGATEAGVFIYIDRTLADTDAAVLPLFQAGLAALDTAAGTGGFAALTPEKQDDILASAEAGKLDGDPGGFFATLLEYTRQGMFSDPIHGGNIEFAGWDLINYPGIKLVWSAEDQAIGTEVEPAHTSVEQYQGANS
jgi:hypothetical protein